MKREETIDKYLRNQLTISEIKEVEERIERDAEFEKEVLEHKNALDIVEAMGFEQTKENLHRLIKKKKRNKAIQYLMILLALLLLGGFVWYSLKRVQSAPLSKEEIYAAYYKDHPVKGIQRGGESEGLDEIQKAYLQKDFSRVNALIAKRTPIESSNLLLVRACALMHMEKWEDALAVLDKAAQLGEKSYIHTIDYYRGLIYLQMDQTERAKTLFRDLSLSETSFADEAKEILKKIR